MAKKFSSLLSSNKLWRVVFNGTVYSNCDILKIISYNVNRWENTVFFSKRQKYYILVIGENSFHYLIYLFLGSCFNLKIIFSTYKNYNTIVNSYLKNKIKCIISVREITVDTISVLKLDLIVPPKVTINYTLFKINKPAQAEIVFCTSGTTSQFKLVNYLEEKLYGNSEIVGKYLNLNQSDKCLCLFPFNYMYGFSITMSTIITNGTVILEHTLLSPPMIVEYLISQGITLLPIVGSIIDEISPYIKKGVFFYNLKVINASDKIFVHQVAKIFKFASFFWNNMGQTESGPRLLALEITKNTIKSYSYNGVVALGRPVHDKILISVKNKQGIECKQKEIGELFYKTIFGMKGYLDRQNQLKDNWHSSGDLVMKKKGIIYWVARKSQVKKVNGIFINPNLLQIYFDALTFVNASAFIIDGNKVFGFFCISNETTLNRECITNKIIEDYRKEFPLYQRMSKIIFMPKIPITESGKISLQKLKKELKRIAEKQG